MNGVQALLYLEFSRLRNFFIASRRQPSRLILWVAAAALIGFFSYMRAARSRGGALQVRLEDPFSSIVGFGAIVAFGVIFGTGANGSVGTFYDAADARYLTMSALSQPLIVLWLQLRNSVLTLLRLGFAMIMYVIFFARGNSSGAFVGLTGGLLLATMIPLPAFELGRHTRKEMVSGVGFTIAAASFACAALLGLGFVFPQLHSVVQTLEAFPVGKAATLLWAGDATALLWVYGSAAILLLAGVAGARDVYPELYAAALKTGGSRRRFIALHRPERGRKTAHSSGTKASGVWTYFWKERITVSRAPALRIMFFIELTIGLLGGAIAGVVGKNSPGILGGMITAIGASLIILLAVSGTSLARDVSKPIWWMGAGSTVMKIAAWCWATSLDTTIVFAGGLSVMSLTSHVAAIAEIGLPAALLLPPLIRAVGVVTYTFFPSAIDQRGPIAALRILVIYLCFAPPIAAGIGAGFYTRSAFAGLAAAFAVFALEGAACIAIASKKLEGRGAEYAVAESR